MAVATLFRCLACGRDAPKWTGRCGACGEWNTLAEPTPAARPLVAGVAAVPIRELGGQPHSHLPTGVSELDRVLGGGVTADSVTLLGGAPGIGKSTLLLQASAGLAAQGSRVLYVSGEESCQQVQARAVRLGAAVDRLWLAAVSTLADVVAHVEATEPDVLVVDSVQVIHATDAAGSPGSPAQVRECAQRLVRLAKDRHLAVVLVGHVTKDGGLAGPRVLEHLVDTVLAFEGDRHHALRLLRAVKHRYGSTAVLGLFAMTERGLDPVADPSRLFLADRLRGVAGSVVVPVVEGGRPLLVEVQALVESTKLPAPRRTATGLDGARMTLLLAVLARHGRINLADQDAYATAVGGVRVTEPGADLALALALASARLDRALPPDLVVCGEVGLTGEVRQVVDSVRRLDEAARLGFRHALVPRSSPEPPPGLELIRVRTLAEALRACRLGSTEPGSGDHGR